MVPESSFEIVHLSDLLNMDGGEEYYNSFVSSFSSINKDVETFLKSKAVQSTKLSTSSTYLVITKQSPVLLAGYFTLATKVLTLKKSGMTKSTERIISRYGYYDSDSESYKIPAILIAQLSRNFNIDSKIIEGSVLMSIVLKKVKSILSQTSGKTVFLECEKKKKLIDFYISNGFMLLDNEVLSKDKKEFIQLYKLF